MTFALRDFDIVKKKFNEAITTMLRREKVDLIDELSQRRKEEYQFLVAVFNELETRIKDSKTSNLKPFIEIFYGAMLVIQQDVRDNVVWPEKPEKSLLFQDLDQIMGIDPDNIPSIHQYAAWHAALNNFLPLIYKNQDSRQGLASPNALDAVSIDRLTIFIKTSCTLEEAAANKITKAFVSDGKATQVNLYKVTKDTPASALAGFTTWKKLKEDLNSLTLDERADKNVPNVKSITNTKRATQIRSLQAVAEALPEPGSTDKKVQITEPERIAILAGMMLLVREQIGAEYSKNPLSTSSTASLTQSGSVTHTGLSKILKIEALSREDAQALITAARNFITYMSIEHSEIKGGVKDAIRTKNIFSGISGYNVTSTLDWMEKLIKSYRVIALDCCVEEYKKNLDALKPKEATTSYISYLDVRTYSFFGKSQTEAGETNEQKNDLESNTFQ